MTKSTPTSPAARVDSNPVAVKSAPKAPVRRIQVRKSGVHGRGVFALVDLAEGELVMEYTGEVISWDEAQRRHPHDPANPSHTFYFHIDDQHVIDGKVGGNSARWINHACEPNCEADEQGGRIFIKTLRNIPAGQELNYDYGLMIDEPYTKKLLAEYPCWCGSKRCRGTLLAPKDDDKPYKKNKSKKSKKSKEAKKANKSDAKDKKHKKNKKDKKSSKASSPS
ncbi:MAG: SET domain-containing protein [Betaproteobacteria bacterium]|nr:SET domain-containing protein [Betaproteobacteria bacterium]NBY72077.1 SET domain-containing protein [Betaproteobacteria bacterium]